jgi:hypothetical protein
MEYIISFIFCLQNWLCSKLVISTRRCISVHWIKLLSKCFCVTFYHWYVRLVFNAFLIAAWWQLYCCFHYQIVTWDDAIEWSKLLPVHFQNGLTHRRRDIDQKRLIHFSTVPVLNGKLGHERRAVSWRHPMYFAVPPSGQRPKLLPIQFANVKIGCCGQSLIENSKSWEFYLAHGTPVGSHERILCPNTD